MKGWSIWSQPLGDADTRIVPAPLGLPLHPLFDRSNRWDGGPMEDSLWHTEIREEESHGFDIRCLWNRAEKLRWPSAENCGIDFHYHHPLSAATTVSRQMVSVAQEAVAAMVPLWVSREVWTGWGNWLSVTEKWEKSMISIKATWVVSVAYNQLIFSFVLISCFPFQGLP